MTRTSVPRLEMPIAASPLAIMVTISLFCEASFTTFGFNAFRKFDDVRLGHDEEVLVRVKREDKRSDTDRTGGALDLADTAVAIGERVGEAATERSDRLVERKFGVQQSPIAQQLRARADARAHGPDEQLARSGLRDVDVCHLDSARGDEQQPASLHDGFTSGFPTGTIRARRR